MQELIVVEERWGLTKLARSCLLVRAEGMQYTPAGVTATPVLRIFRRHTRDRADRRFLEQLEKKHMRVNAQIMIEETRSEEQGAIPRTRIGSHRDRSGLVPLGNISLGIVASFFR